VNRLGSAARDYPKMQMVQPVRVAARWASGRYTSVSAMVAPTRASGMRRLRNQPLIGPGGFVRADQERSSGLGLGLIRCGSLEPVRWVLEAANDGITAERSRDCDG